MTATDVDASAAEQVRDLLAAHFSDPCDDPRCDPFSGRRRSAPMIQHVTELVATALACSHCPSMRAGIEQALTDHFPHGYACGDTCSYVLNSIGGWAAHATPPVLAAVVSAGPVTVR